MIGDRDGKEERNPKTTDLQDAEAPEDVAAILRNAAEKYREAPGDLATAWQDPNAGSIWARIARSMDATARRLDKMTA